ncbi:MAG: hypothetical protein NVSMB4_00620 [Acidimicrobiales bacterium]
MGIFFGGETRSETRGFFPEPPIPAVLGQHPWGSSSLASQPDQALMVPTVWACVSLLANAVSMLPLETFRRTPTGSPNQLPDPPLLTNPSADMTQSEWLHMVMVSLLMRGNAYGHISRRDAYLRPAQIDIFNPDNVRIEVDHETGALTYKVGSAQKVIPNEDMWHVRGMTLPGMKVGLSPIAYAAATLGVDIASRRFAGDFFTAGGIPKAVLSTDQNVDQTQATTIKERLMQATGRREPIVLGAGLTYQAISVSAEESQFLATQQATVAQVARYFGIPAGLVGGSEGGSMCVDTETEMLTTRGWLRHDEIIVGDTCLTMNADTGLAEWQPVEAVFVFDGPHDVMRMRNGTHSSVTTLNHRWPVYQEGNQRMTWRESQTLVSSDVVMAAAPVANLPTEAKWSDAFVETVAWFYTEGWVGSYGEVRIAQSRSANPEKCVRIRAALTSLFGPEEVESHVRSRPAWIEGAYGSEVSHFRLNKLAATELLAVAPGKVPSTDFLSHLTRSQLELFISTSIDADGSTTNFGTPVLGQKDLARLEAFQIACLLAGKSGVIRRHASGMWSMAVQTTARRKPMGRSEYVSVERIDGPVWCPTTPNRSWMARRDGTTYFTGNTYANVEQRGIDFLTFGVAFWLKRLEDATTVLLAGPQFTRFDTKALLRTDAETRAKIWVQLLAGKVVSPSEVRVDYDLAPMTDAQKAEAELVPLEVTPLGGAKMLPPAPTPGAKPAPQPEGA